MISESNLNGLATYIPSSSSFNPSIPQSYSSASILSSLQAESDDGAYGELFEMDRSWETWLQF
jgi:hypothetical protein